MAIEDRFKILEEIFNRDISKKEKLELLWKKTYDDDYLIKYMSYYLIKLLKEQEAVPLVQIRLKEKNLAEEEKLSLLDVLASLDENSAVEVKRCLVDKNPYVVRGFLTALALSGGKLSFDIIIKFASSKRGRIIKRELVGELVGYMLERDSSLKSYFSTLVESNSEVRGYFRDMEIVGPKYGRLSVYPSNDYWALKLKEVGFSYSLFKKDKDLFKKQGKVFRYL